MSANFGKTLDLFPAQATASVHATVPADRPPARDFPPATPSVQPGALSPRQLWLAVHLPLIALEASGVAFQPVRGGLNQPCVVVATVDGQQRVVACNRMAMDQGVAAGMGLNAAYALSSRLQVRMRQEVAERTWLERFAVWAGRFTPRVSVEPDGVLLEVRGSLSLFGGMDRLCERIVSEIHEQGATVSLAIAPTFRASLWLARADTAARISAVDALRNALATLPVGVTGWPEPALRQLGAMGIRTLGECLRLPRDGFARRLGPRCLLELDEALGRLPQACRPFQRRARFKSTLHFEEDVEDQALLQQRLSPLLDKLAAFLQARQSGIQALELALEHRGREPTRQVLRFVTATSERRHIEEMLGESLSRLALSAPVRGATLRSGSLQNIMAISRRISFDVHADRAPEMEAGNLSRLLEKLHVRLGEAAVYGIEVVADHRPERAWRKVSPSPHPGSARPLPKGEVENALSFQERTAERVRCVPSPALRAASPTGRDEETPSGKERVAEPGKLLKDALLEKRPTEPSEVKMPTWLFTQPQLLEEKHGWPHYQGRLEFVQGPQRIESGWWDGDDVARDYYMARTGDGGHVWIYRERRPPRRWFLHGVFG